MNILQIISSPASGGAEVYVKDLAIHLSQLGHSLHIAFVNDAAYTGRNISYEKNFLDELSAYDIKTYFIGNKCRTKPWLGAIRVRNYIKKNNIEVCHAHLAYGIAFSILTQTPVVFTHHQSTPRWSKKVYKLFDLKVDKYIGISSSCTESLKESTQRPTVEIRNAVSHKKFKELIRVRKHKKNINVAMVGRIISYKDYFNMLQALNCLEPSIRDRISINIAGEGNLEYHKALKVYIQKHGLESTVKFVGVKENIPKFLYDCDLFLISSSFEGLPIALIEATISGLPCIVTNVGGCSEVIKSCKNGIIVPPKDPKALAKAITKYILDPTLLQKHSENAIEYSYQYSIDLAAKKHLRIYSELIN